MKTKKKYQYLFKLPVNFYNNEKPAYRVNPLPNSAVLDAYFFAGLNDGGIKNTPSIVYFYIELIEPLNKENQFSNVQRCLNLVYLESGLPTYYQQVPLSSTKHSNFQTIFDTFKSNNFFNEKISYHGTSPKPGHIARACYCAKLWSLLDKKTFEKFDNALNTYIWGLEITQLPNPDLKYTLYMTLFLSSINQLANNPVYCKTHPNCSECDKELFHQTKSEKQAIEDLMKELLTGEALTDGIRKIKKLYSELRSSFLHAGKLSGGEKQGGFLTQFEQSSDLMLDEMDLVITIRQLLEQFLVVKSRGVNQNEDNKR